MNDKHYIGGQWLTPSSSETIAVINPATEEEIARVPAGNAQDIDAATGGKSPFVIFEDADIERAVEWIMFGIFWNQGQVCSATSRVLVQESLYPALLQRLVDEANKIRIGAGDEEGVLLGPLVNAAQYEKVLAAIARHRTPGL